MTIRILIIDTHRVIRNSLTNVLALYKDLQVVGQAEDGQGGLTLCASLQPDVVITELRLPFMDGIILTQNITQNYPDTQVIGLDIPHEDERIEAILQVGAAAYITKDIHINELVETIRNVVHKKHHSLVFAQL